ncbi:hypothetical protein niasHT_034948 [Heterodera trifolii]|uniref:Uncharacterized protein n=1 Tax=Heterodera trifolii TaxID=157864 RepID=A0ABD2I7G7_9BILA
MQNSGCFPINFHRMSRLIDMDQRQIKEADDMLVLNELHRRDGLIGDEVEEEEEEAEEERGGGGAGGDVDQSADEIEFGHVAAPRSAEKAKNAAMIKGWVWIWLIDIY